MASVAGHLVRLGRGRTRRIARCARRGRRKGGERVVRGAGTPKQARQIVSRLVESRTGDESARTTDRQGSEHLALLFQEVDWQNYGGAGSAKP